MKIDYQSALESIIDNVGLSKINPRTKCQSANSDAVLAGVVIYDAGRHIPNKLSFPKRIANVALDSDDVGLYLICEVFRRNYRRIDQMWIRREFDFLDPDSIQKSMEWLVEKLRGYYDED